MWRFYQQWGFMRYIEIYKLIIASLLGAVEAIWLARTLLAGSHNDEGQGYGKEKEGSMGMREVQVILAAGEEAHKLGLRS